MKLRNPLAQMLALVIAAAAIAIVVNGFAAPQRRLLLPGYYPNALKVPPKTTESSQLRGPITLTPAPSTSTTMQSPAPGATPIVVPTETITRPAGDPTTTTAATTTQTNTTTTVAPTPKPSALSPQPSALPTPPADPFARFQPHPDKAYVEISGDEVAALYAAGALFLDARRTSVFEEGHIAGARSFSVWEADVDDKVNKLYEERSDPREQNLPIVIYCSGGACEDSHMLAQKLWGLQFNNVYVYKDGFPDWQKRGGAVKTGATP